MELGVDIVQRHDDSRPVVAQIITTVTAALDSKAALGFLIPVNPNGGKHNNRHRIRGRA